MSFDYTATGNYVSITIQQSKDGGNWTSCTTTPTIGTLNNGDAGTATITGLEAGTYKFRFKNDAYNLDNFEGFKLNANDPAIAVYSNSAATDEVTSGTTKDFGWAQSAQSATYYIKNGGTGTLTISNIAATAGFTAATAGNATTVAAGADPLALTVTMTAGEIGAKSGTITLTTDGGNFTIPVKGFIYGDRNLVDFTNASQYTGWTTDGWTISAGVASVSSSSTMQTTKFSVAANEELYVEAKSNGSFYSSANLTYSYSIDNGENWTDGAAAIIASTQSSSDYAVYTLGDIADTEATRTVLIKFTGANVAINRIYGFEAVATPVMALDKSGDYNFGMQTAAAEYVITVTNNGTGDLENLAAVLTTGTDYSVDVSSTTVAPTESATITVTQKASTEYASHSDVLTISADGVNNVVINLSAKTRDGSKYFADFQTAMPDGWTATGWTRTYTGSNYYAQSNYSGTNTLQTPALTIAAGEEIKYDAWVGYTGGTFKVRYTTNGGISWTESDVEATTTQTTKSLSLNNAEPVTAYIQFVGDNYACIDNFYGGTLAANAPMIKVTKSAVAVANGDTEAFGDILAEATATYSITNAGTGTLTITSPVATTGVATAAIDETSLAAGESTTLTITMPVEAPYGEKSGAVTVETSLGNFVINYTATTMNPNTLNVDFSDNTLPAGWYKESGWNNYSQEIYRSDRNSDQYFMTQKLNVAGTSDVLKFDAKKYGSYYASSTVLKVSYSTDRVNWTEIDSYASKMTTSYKTFEISGLAAGEYYLKFEGRYASIDNIIGWTKVTGIDHDLYVTASTFPATTDKGDDATITATVTSLRADETGVYAKLFINGVQEGDAAAAQDIALNGTKTFSFTYAIPENKTAQIKVYYSDNTEAFATAENAMKVSYTLDEESSDAITAGTFDVTLNRKFSTTNRSTLVLPFAMDATATDVAFEEVYELTGVNGENISFTSASAITAGKPYLVKAKSATLTVDNVLLNPATTVNNTEVSDASSTVTFVGTFSPVTLTKAANSNAYVVSGNNLYNVDSNVSVKAYRGYFTVDPKGGSSVKGFVLNFDNDTDGIGSIENETVINGENEKFYDLSGRRIQKPTKGLYIVNGKKVLVK